PRPPPDLPPPPSSCGPSSSAAPTARWCSTASPPACPWPSKSSPTDPPPMDPHYDVIVVGGRCGGAATAMLLARGGLQVLVVETARPGTDTLSTHALMRGGVLLLDRWGLLEAVVDAGTPALVRTDFVYGEEVETVDITPAAGVTALRAPRRTLLDPL